MKCCLIKSGLDRIKARWDEKIDGIELLEGVAMHKKHDEGIGNLDYI